MATGPDWVNIQRSENLEVNEVLDNLGIVQTVGWWEEMDTNKYLKYMLKAILKDKGVDPNVV